MPVKAFLEVHGVPERDFLGSGKVDVLRAGRVKRETALGVVVKVVRALGVGRLHRKLAIRRAHVWMSQLSHQMREAESGVVEGKRVGC